MRTRRPTATSPASDGDRRTPAHASASAAALARPLQQTIGNQAVQRLLAARFGQPSRGRFLQRDFKSDFEGKSSTPAAPNAPAAPGTVRVQTYAPQDGRATWVNAPYEIYSPGEIPKEYHDQIMESGRAFRWRRAGGTPNSSIRQEMERLENAVELTVGDMVRFSRKGGADMNVRIAMAKVGDDFKFVGYDVSQGDAGGDVHSGFVESESGTTSGVGRALFADRLTRALLNQASGMHLEVYISERTAAFHAEIFAAAGREGAPSEGTKYKLTTTEMAKLVVAWNPKLTAGQLANLNALLAKGNDVSAADAEQALLRGAVEEPPGGSGGGGPPGEIPVEPFTSPGSQAKGALLSFGAQALLAKQISNLQSGEQAKAQARFAELSPEISRLLDANNAVTITVEVEIPKTVNIAGVVTQSDPSMIVYFRDMYIDRAVPVRPQPAAGQPEQAGYHALGDVDEKYGNPRRWDDAHTYTLDQQIRVQMGDPDATGQDKPKHPTHRVMKRSQTITPQTLHVLETAKDAATPAPAPEPKLDEETAKKLADAPTRVELLTENVVQYKAAVQVREKLNANPLFRVTGEAMGGGGRTLTRVVYWSEYDRPRAEKLAELLRAEGLPAAKADSGGDPGRAPGYVQISFGRDAEK
jgi:hypothetical protein